MLIVSRKEWQAVELSGGIKIVVCRIDGNTVRLGIEAPPEIEIVRDDAKRLSPANGRKRHEQQRPSL